VSFVAVLGDLIPATAQQANTTVLDNAALILALSASNPDRLVAMNFMANARADDQKIYRSVVAPCFRAFHDTYQGRLPALQQQLAVVENGMPHRDARGTSASQAVLDAEGYIRAANIAELAITDPAHLANNADFRFNRNIHNQLIRILETWKRMPNSPAAAVSQQIEKQLEEGINSYKIVVKTICKW
jgi:hypothetical protein